jgi:hypothetical protein
MENISAQGNMVYGLVHSVILRNTSRRKQRLRRSKLETNIKDMRIRHKAEIETLQNNCSHKTTKTTSSPFETHTICTNCGKLLKRDRG